ncbi:MAG: ribonuclease HI [Thermoplasmata archaeon]
MLDDSELPHGTALLGDSEEVVVHFDGACQPPKGGGVATYGYTIDGPGAHTEGFGLAVRPGTEHATNNVAEYSGAICALEELRAGGYRGRVVLRGDSQLVIRQMTGEYEVRAEHLKAYHDRLSQLVREFALVRFEWVPRDENLRADELSKVALANELRAARRSASKRSALSTDEA